MGLFYETTRAAPPRTVPVPPATGWTHGAVGARRGVIPRRHAERRTGPRFTDDGLRTPREGTPYSDGVAATGRGTITYSISAGALPAGLTLNPTTGAVIGTPSACTREPATPFPFAIVYSWLRSLVPSCDYEKYSTMWGSAKTRRAGVVSS